MSAAEIIKELPKLTGAELIEVERKLKELTAKDESSAFLDQITVASRQLGKADDDARRDHLMAFFSEWDVTRTVTVGDKPTRERTYADNPRLR